MNFKVGNIVQHYYQRSTICVLFEEVNDMYDANNVVLQYGEIVAFANTLINTSIPSSFELYTDIFTI